MNGIATGGHDRVADQQIQPLEFFLRPGYVMAHKEDMIIRCVLGSCVAVSMYDRKKRFGGMNQFIWPTFESVSRPTVTFGAAAIPTLFRLLVDMGAKKRHMEAQIFGGASPERHYRNGRPTRRDDVGRENCEIARSILKRMGVPVVSEDVGGCKGRKVVYHTGTNETIICKVNDIRKTDWYVHGQEIDWSRA